MSTLRFALAALALAGVCAPPAISQTLGPGEFRIQPEAPKARDGIRVRAAPGAGCDTPRSRETTLSMANNRVTITIPVTPASGCFATPPAPVQVDVSVGQLPPGQYELEVMRLVDGVASSLGARSFTVSPRTPLDPLVDYTDLWWDPNESGWGLNIIQHPSNVIFATWFTYDDDGTPAWFVVSYGQWSAGLGFAPNVYYATIYRTSGPTGGSFNPQAVTRTPVGNAKFDFGGVDTMTATLTINGRTTEKRLQRQSF
jgi:hypothetical protein